MALVNKKSFFAAFLVLVVAFMSFTPAFALAVYDISPSVITNDVANTITVTGAGFADGAIVYVGDTPLSATFFSKKKLTFEVPAAFPAGHAYAIKVLNPGADAVVCDCKLRVNDSPVTPPLFGRPQLIVASSYMNIKYVNYGDQFKFVIDFKNAGDVTAYSPQIVFTSEDVAPLRTGGVLALDSILPGRHEMVEQSFLVSSYLYGKNVTMIDATATYYDDAGVAYSDKFSLSIPVGGVSSETSVTATPTGVRSGQLIISSYSTSFDPLQPGVQFKLTMTVQNAGNEVAQRVTMIVGGGSSGSDSTTPQPGGVSGGGGEFTNFAPLGTSNVQSLGDLPAGGMMQVSQKLIVNVSTNPGAYPIKITFSYLNAKGEVINDEQIITLLVYSLPKLEISFYRPLDPFFVSQPGALPIQVVNTGKSTAVLGNMTVTSKNGAIEGGASLIGALEAGGSYTLDATLSPDAIGKTKLNVTIDYIDDFNQSRKIEKIMEVNVVENFVDQTDPSVLESDGQQVESASPETFIDKVGRFLLGLLGLDSAPPLSSAVDG
jgi:hypothetical protein